MPKTQTKVVNPKPTAVEKPPEEATTTTAAIQKTASNLGLMPNAPDWLKKKMAGQKPRGLEKLDTADLILPRLSIAQSTSPEVSSGQCGVGDIFDNLTKTVLAKRGEPLLVIPISLAKSRIMFEGQPPNATITCRADDALTARQPKGKDMGDVATGDCEKCVFKEWDDDKDAERGGRPKCTLFYNEMVLLPEFENRAYVFSAKSTQVPVMRRLLSTIKQTGADSFAGLYAIKSVEQKADKLTWQNFDFESKGYVSEEQYAIAEQMFNSVSEKTWAPNTEDLETEVASETTATVDAVPVTDQNSARQEAKAATHSKGGEEDPF